MAERIKKLLFNLAMARYIARRCNLEYVENTGRLGCNRVK